MRKVVCTEVNRQNHGNGVHCYWLLWFLVDFICCKFSQFNWITYDFDPLIDHLNLLIMQENLWITSQLELTIRLVMTRSCFHVKLPLLNPVSNSNAVIVVIWKSSSPAQILSGDEEMNASIVTYWGRPITTQCLHYLTLSLLFCSGNIGR